MPKEKFEGSKWDNDKGVKEGSDADKKRDRAQKAKMREAMAEEEKKRKKEK